MGLVAVNIQAKTSVILSASNTRICLERPKNSPFNHHIKSEEKKEGNGGFQPRSMYESGSIPPGAILTTVRAAPFAPFTSNFTMS